MKKAVFIFIFWMFLMVEPVHAIDGDSFIFDENEFHLSRVSNDNGGIGYHIIKLGKDPFEIDYVLDQTKIKINHIAEIRDFHVLYGYTHKNHGETYYDPFLLVLDQDGNELYLNIEDRGDLEAVHKVFEMDDLMFVHYIKSTDNEEKDIVFSENIFEVYDFQFNLLNSLTNTDEYYRTLVTESLYVYTLDVSPPYEGGITSNLEMVYRFDTLDIPTDQIFLGEVDIPFVNQGVLNGEIKEHGVSVKYPGNYELLYNDYLYRFSVDPIVSGVSHKAVYTEQVTPIISAGNVYLNNDLFVSGTTISRPGNYQLSIIGINNYRKTIDFTITSNMSGVMNNQVYQNEVELQFEGDGYLNNLYIESPYIVQDPGEYLFKIKGENEYMETYYFEVESGEPERGIIDFVQKYDIVFLVVVVVSGGIMLKKK
jgi:hypothetical protein